VKLRDAAPTTRVLLVAIMVSMVAFLDNNVVNQALPATERDLGGGLLLQPRSTPAPWPLIVTASREVSRKVCQGR